MHIGNRSLWTKSACEVLTFFDFLHKISNISYDRNSSNKSTRGIAITNPITVTLGENVSNEKQFWAHLFKTNDIIS